MGEYGDDGLCPTVVGMPKRFQVFPRFDSFFLPVSDVFDTQNDFQTMLIIIFFSRFLFNL